MRLQFSLCAPIVPLRDATFLQMTRLLQVTGTVLVDADVTLNNQFLGSWGALLGKFLTEALYQIEIVCRLSTFCLGTFV